MLLLVENALNRLARVGDQAQIADIEALKSGLPLGLGLGVFMVGLAVGLWLP